jgi:hypothetical protein
LHVTAFWFRLAGNVIRDLFFHAHAKYCRASGFVVGNLDALLRGFLCFRRVHCRITWRGCRADFKAKLGQPETATDAAALVDKDRAAGADIVKLFTGSIVAPNYIIPMRVEIARAAVDEGHKHAQLVPQGSQIATRTIRKRVRALQVRIRPTLAWAETVTAVC